MKTVKLPIKMKYMDKDSCVITLLKRALEKSDKNYTDITKETGLSKQVISKVINAKQYASISMYFKIGNTLGIKKEQIATAWKKDKIVEIDVEIAEFLESTK